MYHRYTWVQNHASVALPEPRADIHIFVVKEEAFVETTKLAKNACRKEQEHPGSPVHVLRRAAFNFDAPIAQPDELAQQARQRREMPSTVLQTTIGISNRRRDDAAVPRFESKDELGKWVVPQPDVRVEYREQPGFTEAESLIVIGAESERMFVADHAQTRAKWFWTRDIVFRNVLSEDDR